MTQTSRVTRGAIAAIAGVMALGAAATAAHAQSYPAYSGGNSYNGYYDPCRRDANNRGLVGALIGGAGGATIGSQFSASGHRRDGSLLGGILGAVAGASIGHNTAACQSQGYVPQQQPGPQSSYAPELAPYAYDDRAQRYDDRYDGDAYRNRGDRYRIAARPDADGCTLAESPILMPDGRTQMHFVRVCMDRNGRYQVVN